MPTATIPSNRNQSRQPSRRSIRARLARQARVARRMQAVAGGSIQFHIPSAEAMTNALSSAPPLWAAECGFDLIFNLDLPVAGLDADLPAWAIENLRRLGETCLTAAERIDRAQAKAAARVGGAA